RVDGVDTDAGTYDLPSGTTVNITAVPLEGYTLDPDAVTSWSFTGNEVRGCGGGSGPVPETPTTEATTTTTEPPSSTTTTTEVPQPIFTGESGEVEGVEMTQPPAAPAAELPFTGNDVGELVALAVSALG